MKKIVCLIMLTGFIFSFNSCQKGQNDLCQNENENLLLVQSENLTVEQLLNESLEVKQFKTDLGKVSLKSAKNLNVDFNKILKYDFKIFKFDIFFVPFVSNNGKSLIIFKKGQSILYSVCHSTEFDRIKTISLSSLHGEDYFSIIISDQDKVLDFIENSEIIFFKEFIKSINSDSILKSAIPTCDEKTDNFVDCFECSWEEMTDDALGTLACTLAPQSCTMAAIIHCAL